MKKFIMNWFPLLGGVIFGLGIPIGNISFLSSQIMDKIIFFPLGIIMLSLSAYYLLWHKEDTDG